MTMLGGWSRSRVSSRSPTLWSSSAEPTTYSPCSGHSTCCSCRLGKSRSAALWQRVWLRACRSWRRTTGGPTEPHRGPGECGSCAPSRAPEACDRTSFTIVCRARPARPSDPSRTGAYPSRARRHTIRNGFGAISRSRESERVERGLAPRSHTWADTLHHRSVQHIGQAAEVGPRVRRLSRDPSDPPSLGPSRPNRASSLETGRGFTAS